MINLIQCEYRKFKGTFITLLTTIGMLSPLVLVTVLYIIREQSYRNSHSYNWTSFNNELNVLLIFLVGPIITSFISVFSIIYEYHGKTMKNLITSPHSRLKIIISKLLSVSILVLLQYLVVVFLNVLIALSLDFNITPSELRLTISTLIVAGFFNLLLVPLMMFISLLFKSFVPALLLTIIGTISNALILNWEHSYISPWSLSADFVFIMRDLMDMKLIFPTVSASLYLILFLFCCITYFKKSNQPT